MALWENHWSFNAPKQAALPKVKNRTWIKNAIDAFILARLESEGLAPSPQADHQTLIRRVAFDLTGLPPTLKEIDEFVNDKTPTAYGRMVDRYLASKAYGERMTLAWMDAARYGDSSVYHADGPRDMWPWRDWVINAYNRNMPFDQFTIEQLAGDLMPGATIYQKIASGFNRNNGTTDEGGVIPEEYRVEYAVDRVKTTSNVWLGLSMECSQCHEHKFDPITHQEYYQFYAFFNQSSDKGMQTRKGNAAPLVNVPDTRNAKERMALEKQVAPIDIKLKAREAQVEAKFRAWVKDESASRLLGDKKTSLPADMLAHFQLDQKQGAVVTDQVDPKRKATVKGKALWVKGKFANGFKVNRKNYIDLGDIGNFERTDSFSYGCWIKPDNVNNGAPLAKMNDKKGYRGYDLYFSAGKVAVHIINTWPGNAIKVNTKAKIKAKQWTHVFATYDGSSKAAGIKIYFNGKEQPWTIEQDRLSGTIKTKVPLYVGRRNPGSPYAGIVDDIRIYKRALTASEVAALAGSDPIGPILALPATKRSKRQQQTLRTHYLQNVDAPYKKLSNERAKLQGRIAALSKTKTTVMVMGDVPKPRQTYVLMRGNYASPDKKQPVKPGVPKVLGPMPKGAPANRLGLAQWLTSPSHPLTARVAINRYWSMFFGRGIVETVLDFGSQGAWPSHQELLDWLAVDFVKNGWDVKRTIKQMLMSATYRQSSRVTAQLKAKDSLNILLARGPRFRLQGEFIRDTALAVSGLLVQTIGGPGVKPYQPPGLWNALSLGGNVRFRQDSGDKLYRRSMYIYWKRSAPHPGMRIFDAPTREKCVVQRPRTNTPLQALVTLNDPQFVEAARFLAQRMMLEGGKTAEQRITFAYRLATAHKPSRMTLRALSALYARQLSKYRAAAAQAKQLLAVGEGKRDESLNPAEHAAWTIIASVILNLDASLTKG